MEKIGIVVCSSISRTKEVKNASNIEYAYLKATLDGKEYTYGDITLRDFFDIVEEKNEAPRTSQPATGELVATYEKMLKKYEDVIVLAPSINLSGTFQNAVLAKSMIADESQSGRIHCIDTQGIAMTETILCEEILRLEDEMPVDKIVEHCVDMASRFCTYGIPGSLKFLKQSGRVNLSQVLIGTLIHLKIVVKVQDNIVDVAHKCRGGKSLLKVIEAEVEDKKPTMAYYTSICEDEKVKKAVLAIFDKHNVKYKVTDEADIVSGTHFGPSSFGFTFIR